MASPDMSSSINESENILYVLDYLDDNIPYLSDIYNCPCENCIISNKEKINSMINYIISFYKFIIRNKDIIKKNDTYIIKIKNLLSDMFKFNNQIINKNENIIYYNLEISVSIIYLEEEDCLIYEKPFSIDTFNKYYPEMKILLEN